MTEEGKIPEISVQELKTLRDSKEPHFLLDVREPSEYSVCKIEGSTPIPMAEIAGRFGELPKDQTIVVYCHHGPRSAQVVRFLVETGLDNAKNLTGGIDAWSIEIDPEVLRY